jgi:pimeloyl-ACP methyl ester carboxylesterase
MKYAIQKTMKLVALLAATMLLVACPSEGDNTPTGAEPDSATDQAKASLKFSPFTGEFPLPINILFDLDPTSTDFTLDIPSESPPAIAGNQLDGWSTVAPFTIAATEDLTLESVQAPGAVRVFRVCGDPFKVGAPTGKALGELELGKDFSVGLAKASDATIIVKPLKPLVDKYDETSVRVCDAGAQGNLNKGNTYIVVVTNAVQSADGDQVGPSDTYELMKNPLCFYKFETDRYPDPDDETAPAFPDCPGTTQETPTGVTQAGIEAGIATAADSSQQSTENIRRLIAGQEALAQGISAQANAMGSPLPVIDTQDIALSYSFSTVAIDNPGTLQVPVADPRESGEKLAPVTTKFLDTWDIVKLAANASGGAQTVTVFETGETVTDTDGSGRILVGELTVPYYLTAFSPENPTGPLTEPWRADPEKSLNKNSSNLTFFNPAPIKTQDIKIPLLAVVPNTPPPQGGYPVAILQHGITTNRVAVGAVAEQLSRNGIASVSIDLPLHGISSSDPTFAKLRSDSDELSQLPITAEERTFDVDYLNAEGAAGPDGVADPSGSHFINLSNLVVSRDNLRQAVSDLLTLKAALINLRGVNPLNQTQTAVFDSTNVMYFGHSLGGIVGGTFLAQADDIDAASLATPGAGIAKLLDASAAFGPRITLGLSAAEVFEGTADFESFLYFAQAAVDIADPVNQASKVTAPLHMIEVVGGGLATSLPPAAMTIPLPSDLVVPNNAFDPQVGPDPDSLDDDIEKIPETGLGGTQALTDAFGITNIESRIQGTCNTRSNEPTPVVVQFDTGSHSTVAIPTDTINGLDFDFSAEFAEMLSQVVGFFKRVANGAAAEVPIDVSCASAG